jgi:hypothetical protein
MNVMARRPLNAADASYARRRGPVSDSFPIRAVIDRDLVQKPYMADSAKPKPAAINHR